MLPSSPPRTQYDDLRDGNFEHLLHEVEDDQRATQRLRFRPNRLGDNAIADNGIIQSITCVNFMCHQRLHCELGPLLNFIVGENGSGKSAILTAITLCLGGKASSTNRGGSLKSFVKEGSERAVLSVKIKNQGADAYKHDIYGDSILVERHFSKTGSSGFKVKTETGQIISSKRQEIEDIVEYFALQVDNPLNVLSQDNARQFLNASTKAQKYKFFIEGVQLQQLDNDYRLIKENLDHMIAKVPDQEERVKLAENALDAAKRKKEAIEGNRQIREKHKTLRNQLAWCQVNEQERELEKRTQVLAEANNKVLQAEANVEEKRRSLQHEDEKIARATEAIETVTDEVSKAEEGFEQAREARQLARAELEKILSEERDAQNRFSGATEKIKILDAKIAAEQERLEKANGETHSLKLRELETARTKVQDLEKQIELVKSSEPGLKAAYEEAVEKEKAKGMELKGIRQKRSGVEEQIKQLQQGQRSLYDAYEAQVPSLVQRIERENGFRQKPIGPLGVHISLLKPEWSSILEQTFGKTLNAFLVTNQQDSKLLQHMMKQLAMRDTTILLCPLRNPLDLRAKEPDESFDTILRVLKFDNVLIRDQLVISHMIEQIILVPERTRAQDIVFRDAPPQNVKAAICFQDGNRAAGFRLSNNNGGLTTTPIQSRGSRAQKPRMKGDTGSHIAVLRERLNQIDAELKAADQERRLATQEVQKCKTGRAKQRGDLESLTAKLRHAEAATIRIEEELDQFEGVDGRLRGLQEQREELEVTRGHEGRQFAAIAQAKQAKNAVCEDRQKSLRAARQAVDEAKARIVKLEDRKKRYEDTRRFTLSEVNALEESLEQFRRDRERLQGSVERCAARVQEWIVQAQTVHHTRVAIPDGETHESLESQYNVLTARLKAEDKRYGMSETEVNNLVLNAAKERDRAVADLQSIVAVNQGLKQTLALRLHRWRLFQRFISAQSRCNFQYLLSERGFRGKLLFDHQKKYLDLQVEPDKTEKRASGRSTKTLSGGEKSFSSICLLLSIWEAMGSPLRCLDEFDVFMDNVNRAISTNMLVGDPFCTVALRIGKPLIHSRSLLPAAPSTGNIYSSHLTQLKVATR